MWQGRRLTLFSHIDGEQYAYTYNANGIRTGKQHSDADGNVVGISKYTLDGNKIIAEDRNGTKIYYTYDDKGAIMGMIYGGVSYVFSKNLQGDVIGIYNESGNLVAKYEYNAFGKITAITDASGNDVSGNATHIANINPFRYRGYYYDTETGFYYLQSRYYDPIVGRFLNADAFVSTGQGIIGNNMFAYCGNNPTNYADNSGMYFLTIVEGMLDLLSQRLEAIADSVKTSYTSSGTTIIKGGGVYASVSDQLDDAIHAQANIIAETARFTKSTSDFIGVASTTIDCASSIYNNIANDELSTQRKVTDSLVDVGFSLGISSGASYVGAKIGTILSPGWGTVVGMGVGVLGELVVEYTPVDEWAKDGVNYVVDGFNYVVDEIGGAINSFGKWTGWW